MAPSATRVCTLRPHRGHRLRGGRYADNPYGPGDLLISKRAFGEALGRDENLVEIFI